MKKKQKQSWREGAVVYQIYPRSFMDASGDGVGDLKGIIKKLDYLNGKKNSLGVTAIWLSPIYTSPMADFGYDVSNYTDIDPLFGKLADLKKLVKEAHKRGIKVMMDFVPNHSSDEHPWFEESRSSLDNPKRDWYIWRDPTKNGGPPNNWLSIFNGPAWEYDERTKQYYLHTFLTKQPDLNWENPEVREAIKNAMRFWLDLGIDGFRVDAVDTLSKDLSFRNDTRRKDIDPAHHNSNEYWVMTHTYSREGPKLFKRLKEMSDVLKEYDDRFMVAEAHPESREKLQGYLDYYEQIDPAHCAPFNFDGIFIPWEAAEFQKFIDAFQGAMEPAYTPVYALGNHDESRLSSRFGAGAVRTAAMMLLTLPGMAFVYYGEELGMHDVPIPEELRQDPGAHRDPERTPMQWDATPHAGFSKAKPWLPVAHDYKKVNVAVQQKDKHSVLNLYKQLIRFRQDSPALRSGSYEQIKGTKDIFAFKRVKDNETLLILLNFSNAAKPYRLPEAGAKIVLSTKTTRGLGTLHQVVDLHPHEGLIIKLTS